MIRSIILIFLAGLILSSCNPFLSKELRRKNKCNRKLEKTIKKCPELLDSLTTEIEIHDTLPPIEIHDTFYVKVDTSKIDSVLKDLDKIETKEEKIKYLTKYIPKLIRIDTSVVRQGITINILLENGSLEISIDKPEEVRTHKAEITTPVVTPVKLTWPEKLINGLWSYWWWVIALIVLIFLSIRGFRKLFL